MTCLGLFHSTSKTASRIKEMIAVADGTGVIAHWQRISLSSGPSFRHGDRLRRSPVRLWSARDDSRVSDDGDCRAASRMARHHRRHRCDIIYMVSQTAMLPSAHQSETHQGSERSNGRSVQKSAGQGQDRVLRSSDLNKVDAPGVPRSGFQIQFMVSSLPMINHATWIRHLSRKCLICADI